MSSPLQVRITRAGKEIGTYAIEEALRLFALGHLLATDHYWHEGMPNWALLPKLKEGEDLRLKSEAEEKAKIEKAEKEMRERDEERIRQKVEEAVRERIAEEKAQGGQEKAEENYLGCIGGVLFVGGIFAFLLAYSLRNAQEISDLSRFFSGPRRYTPIDPSGYDAAVFIAVAVALLGLGLFIAGLARMK